MEKIEKRVINLCLQLRNNRQTNNELSGGILERDNACMIEQKNIKHPSVMMTKEKREKKNSKRG